MAEPGTRELRPLRADMDAAVSRACGELDQVRQTLEQISGELARQDEGLDKLTSPAVPS